MELKLLNTRGITSFGGESYSCGCQRVHAAQTAKIFFEAGAVDKCGVALAEIVPPLSHIGIISDGSDGRAAEKSLVRHGYRLSLHKIKRDTLPSIKAAKEIDFGENVRAIMAVGGENVAAIAKYKAQEKGVELMVVLTSPLCIGVLTPSSMLFEGGIEHIYKTRAPKVLLVDTNLLCDITAAAFGAICSKVISLFDWKVASILNREVFCTDIFEQGFAVIDEAIFMLSKPDISPKSAKVALCEATLKFSALTQLLGNSRLLCGGEAQCAHALHILFDYEKRTKKLCGEDEILFSRMLVSLYKSVLQKRDTFFVPPPDNNMRLERIKEFLGLEESVVINRMRPQESPQSLSINGYKLSEYFGELVEILAMCENRLRQAWRIFKRLYEDGGYSFVSYLDEADVSLCVSLAADLKEKYTLLTYMKNAGFLDAYLIDLIV